jgi:hypothetical protein
MNLVPFYQLSRVPDFAIQKVRNTTVKSMNIHIVTTVKNRFVAVFMEFFDVTEKRAV